MSSAARRKDLRGVATRAALIEQAETLFGERGVDGVSLREIGAAIGAANSNVVLYHFGSKAALIEETIRHRLPHIDRRRAAMLAEHEAGGRPMDLARCLDILFRPLFEQVNAEGHHSYIAFLHSLHRSNNMGFLSGVSRDYPATMLVVTTLCQLSGLPEPRFARRLQVIVGMIAWALRLIDQRPDDAAASQDAFADALVMARAALIA